MSRHCHRCVDGEFTENPKLLLFAFALTALFAGVEFIGGRYTGSWALVSDSFHMGIDAFALFIAATASSLAQHFRTFSSKIKTRAAFLNAILLMALSIFVAVEAYERVWISRDILSMPMLGIAVIGLLVNAFEEWLLRHQAFHDLNTRGAYLHIVGDYVSSVGVIAAALVIFWWDWKIADALAAFVVALLMLISGFVLARASLRELKN